MDSEKDDYTKYRYVIYARKSTDDPQRQVRSIEDQIAECKQLADRLKLRVIGQPIIEKKSAKKPNKRPLFRQMLNDIKQGKFDGIIAWNPDRLARNMKEGGEVIDMIDDDYIKDMKFVTHHFSKDANGKMLLGMAFVLSKQYSDNLSQNVTRGVRRNFAEGKSQIPKHGYIRGESKQYIPDGKNFDLIQKAWSMRKEGKSLEVIVTYLNTNNYGRTIKSTGKQIKMTKQILSDLFRDPFYFGILVQAGEKVDLTTIYDFTTTITEQDYLDVQALTNNRITPYNKKKRVTYLPLKMMITCSYCDHHMYAGVSTGNTRKYLFYRCDNKFCTRKKKGIRAHILFDFINDFLKDGLHFTEADYHKYYGSLTQLSQTKRQQAELEIYSKQAVIRSNEAKIKEISYKLVDYHLPEIAKQANIERLSEYQNTNILLKAEVAKLKEKLTNPEDERISIEQFLNLSKNAAKIIQSGDGVIKDAIVRLLFLNFSVDEEKVLSYQLKPPFDELLKTRSVVSSRGQRT